jgi:pilus assembly protein CpaF
MDQQISSDALDQAVNLIVNKMASQATVESDEIRSVIEEVVFQLPSFKTYSLIEKGNVAEIIFNRMCAYDVLQAHLDDTSVTEIMCNGYQSIFIERNGCLQKTNTVFYKESQYKALLQRVASEVNRKIDFSSPIVDARLKDGSRVNIVLDPVAINGPILTIRKFNASVYSLEELYDLKTMTYEEMLFLKQAITQRKNIFISGGTGSGKTTLLNALCQEIDPTERLITIEDSAEIVIKGLENVVSLEKRDANLEGLGEISIATLIKTALRMRPDRIIVGEIRGSEAIDMLQAMNTGHSGSISTGHSNSPKDMLNRIETMVLSGMEIPIQAIRQQIASAIDVIVHIERLKGGQRKISSIALVNGYAGNEYDVDYKVVNEGEMNGL